MLVTWLLVDICSLNWFFKPCLFFINVDALFKGFIDRPKMFPRTVSPRGCFPPIRQLRIFIKKILWFMVQSMSSGHPINVWGRQIIINALILNLLNGTFFCRVKCIDWYMDSWSSLKQQDSLRVITLSKKLGSLPTFSRILPRNDSSSFPFKCGTFSYILCS